jgi:hypothetical protein
MKNSSPIVGRAKQSSDLTIPVFAAGQMLRHDDLAALATYTHEITRLMLRSLFGCGVVCGLCVRASLACGKLTVTVEPGVALDCQGDIIYVPKTTTITVDPTCDTSNLPDYLWVVLRGFQKCCAPRPVACSPDDDEVASTCTREQYWYEIQVLNKLPDCVCRCTPPPKGKATGSSQSAEGPTLYDAAGKPAYAATDPSATPETPDCYKDHEAGKCSCACPDCTTCKCEWVLLARIANPHDDREPWDVEHRVRRFVRPMLLPDRGCQPDTVETEPDQDVTTPEDSETDMESGAERAKPEQAPADRRPAPKKVRSKPAARPRTKGVVSGVPIDKMFDE